MVPLTPSTIVAEESLRAELAAVRERGWCFVDQELETGLRSIAVPVFGADGTVQAALNVSTSTPAPSAGTPEEPLATALEMLPRLSAAAERISAALRARR